MTQWKLVPVEPTEEMLAKTSWPDCARTDYAHMLAAAPEPDVQEPSTCKPELQVQEPDAYLYTLEYGQKVYAQMVSKEQRNYPFGAAGPDYQRENKDGVSYVRQTPLYTHPPAADVQELVGALKEIIEHCPNSWAEIRADVALKIWEGK